MSKLVQDVGGEVLGCGLDYLRVTAHDFEPALPEVLQRVKWMQDRQENDGHKRTGFGIDEFAGESCGGWRHAKQGGLTLLEASGERSSELLKFIKDSNLDCRGTRVDLHVTYNRVEHEDDWATEMLALVRKAEAEKEITRQIRCEVIDHPRKGNTLYSYSRYSRRFLRDYDKSAQQRHKIPIGTFRAEGEYKREMARAMFGRVRHTNDVQALALDVLTQEWRRLGIDRNWDWKGEPIDLGLEKRPSDQITTARWFMRTAVPAFRKLTDPTLLAECLEALLTDPTTGAYRDFEAPAAPPAPAPRKPRAEVAAEARKKIKESLNLPPHAAHSAAVGWVDNCFCDTCVSRRAAEEAQED